ncbi:hypothetical protein [Bacillus sp. FJAT-49736]|uniref:hypothetical protein n=1 Tax=Bacillus sp. FJAT-49736 TaxID=2833582 RepID=UPI001BC98372|nr:hypothetical protein [Bacillus sp. FJAT-49736]MBS4172101.1 hypothetical protein [Bacillus sp. FJAT-49736]
MGRKLKKIKFEIIEPIHWDNWGRIVVAFRKGDICTGEGEFDEEGNLIYASAESSIYDGISDSIPIESIHVINRTVD